MAKELKPTLHPHFEIKPEGEGFVLRLHAVPHKMTGVALWGVLVLVLAYGTYVGIFKSAEQKFLLTLPLVGLFALSLFRLINWRTKGVEEFTVTRFKLIRRRKMLFYSPKNTVIEFRTPKFGYKITRTFDRKIKLGKVVFQLDNATVESYNLLPETSLQEMKPLLKEYMQELSDRYEAEKAADEAQESASR